MSRIVPLLTARVLLSCTLPAAPAAAQEGSVRVRDVVLHYWPGQERLARSLLPGDAGLRFAGVAPDVFDRGEDVNVFIAPDGARWDSLTGGRAPDWGAGIALPFEDIIFLPGYVSDRGGTHTLPMILRHELAHIALQRHVGEVRIPRWFNEGFATWSAGQFDADAGWMLRVAFLTRRAPPLDSLTLDWPLLEADARLAYLLSASAVRFLYSLGQPETFDRFMRQYAATGSFEQALREVYVVSSVQLERLWRSHVRRNYGWLQLLAQSLFIWLIITILVLVLIVVRRRRDRRRLARMREAELPDEPAFWAEPPPGSEPGAGGADGADGAGEGRDGREGRPPGSPAA
jgi:hypothetical protein